MGKEISIKELRDITSKKSANPSRKNEESRLQKECVKWFRLQHPKLILFSVPNGARLGGETKTLKSGKRLPVAVIRAKNLKDEGALRGVPDLVLAHPSLGYHGLFIEMKTDVGRPSPEQVDLLKRLRDEGYRAEICRSFDEFKSLVNEYLG